MAVSEVLPTAQANKLSKHKLIPTILVKQGGPVSSATSVQREDLSTN